jgi:hypothetical protein
VSFKGSRDYITVEGTDYAHDARFTISFWMTKERCTDENYEYLYSHHNSVDRDQMYKRAFINIYLACESAGSGGSTLEGSILRYNVHDDNTDTPETLFDYPLHDAGDFDSVTNVWVHVILAVTRSACTTFADGTMVDDNRDYGVYLELADKATNNAYPHGPSNLTTPLGTLTLGTDIYLGARADKDVQRHFKGSMALLTVLDHDITPAAAMCLFLAGDAALPDPVAIYRHSACAPVEMDVTFVGDTADRSGNQHSATLHKDATVDENGARFDGDGDYATVASFPYATEATFSVAFWMTKVQCASGVYEYMYSHAQDPAKSILDMENPNINI